MAYIIKMPKLGMGMNEGTLLQWFVSLGDEVTDGDPIAEIESEKTVAEITASEDGVLRRVYVSKGETVEPGTALGIVAEHETDLENLEAQIELEPLEMGDETADASATAPGDTNRIKPGDGRESGQLNRIRASPKAKKRASELGITLSNIEGSGPNGAITVADIEAANGDARETSVETEGSQSVGMDAGRETVGVKATPKARRRARSLGVDLAGVDGSGPDGAVTATDLETANSDEATSFSGGDSALTTGDPAERSPVEERELDGMRRTIANRLGQSYREAVHVTVHRRIDMEEALAATDVVDEYLDVDASVMDVVLVALSATLEEHPEFNATFEDGIHRIHDQQNISVAVDIENGLITPVLPGVMNRSLNDLAQGRREVTNRALSGDYTTADLSGGTFTISNLGVFGVDSFTPIINPPEIAILGVDRISERPVRGDNGVKFRRFGGVDLTFDHRVVDGADAARFLDTLATHLAEPWPLLLDRA
ncbi:dihydrolipoamide acetyltransferase family protein [Haladaptatus halobius]|uniref:dihydrolipoamide acetyltransferase family protein n=1 Tax=Haladaptatus halobius TaxID=2884875 RepID=UPI001D0A6918|nr:dihydrolipoamide acetyltransferase family protein [Haladaptatus halobius]